MRAFGPLLQVNAAEVAGKSYFSLQNIRKKKRKVNYFMPRKKYYFHFTQGDISVVGIFSCS